MPPFPAIGAEGQAGADLILFAAAQDGGGHRPLRPVRHRGTAAHVLAQFRAAQATAG